MNSDGITDTQDYSLILYSLKNDIKDELIELTPTPTLILTPTTIPTSTTIPTPTTIPTLIPTPIPNTPTPITLPTPTPTSNLLSYCQLMRNELPNSRMIYPNSSTTLPQTTSKICAWRAGFYYSLPYRNPNCRVTQEMIDRAYSRMITFYPNYYQQTKLKEQWQIVQELSIRYNFNPLFVISLWIEESAAGGATQAQQLGCLYRRNKDDTFTFLNAESNACEQMECLFGSGAVDPKNFDYWACRYQHGYNTWNTENNDCLKVTTFTRTIEFWYNYMSRDGSLLTPDCQIKQYSPSNPQCL